MITSAHCTYPQRSLLLEVGVCLCARARSFDAHCVELERLSKDEIAKQSSDAVSCTVSNCALRRRDARAHDRLS
jgi:hypothetical protein